MRLATIRTARGERLHVGGRAGYIDIADALDNPILNTMAGYLSADEAVQEDVRQLSRGEGTQFSETEFAAPVPAPKRVLCVGVNYSEHAIEASRAHPAWPEAFVRGTGSVLGPYDDMVKPALTERFDFEGELGVVIGRGGRYIPTEKAGDAIAGFVVLNDGSAREWQRKTTQWTPGKNFDGTMPMGPVMVTPDELDYWDLQLSTVLNGQVMQSARTSQMIVDVASCIEFFSSFTTLEPGDVIATGTPGGVGFARKPPIWLQPGDVIEVTIEGIGTIRNRLVAETGFPGSWRWSAAGTNTDTL